MNAHVLYVSAHETRQILAFGVNAESGALDYLHATTIDGPAGPSPHSIAMALDPTGDLLYAAMRMPPYPIATFRIDRRSGALQNIGNGRLADSVCYIAVDGTGHSLISASHSGAKLLNNRIDDTGVVTSDTRQLFQDVRKAHSVVFDRANDSRTVYAAALGDNGILQLRYDKNTAQLSNNTPPSIGAPPGAGPRHLVIHPRLAILYCLNETLGTIDAYRIERPGGALTHCQTILAMPRDTPRSSNERAADIHVTPDGRYLYSSERSHDTLSGFSIDPASGTLSYLASWKTESQPRGFRIHPTGRFLYCAGHRSGHIASYSIDADSGHLRAIARVQAGSGPNWIEIVSLQPGDQTA